MAELQEDCLFCKIIRKEIPSYTVFENDDIKVFLDISQVTRGHVLLVPKKHLVNFFDYSQEDAAKFLQYIPKIANAVKNSNPDIKGVNVIANNGEAAGQVVMHSHIHFIPRYENDNVDLPHANNASQYNDKDYLAVANSIKKHLN
ncbi:HIT family protein [Lactobacillus sp. PV037]|uniref:HIT family protein n=1 Tax=unclassified Lactobacillus TaxID=2620435 RepID=UPI00223FB3F8|nr:MULTISPECIES: HIT family protein [unclassified Lactobacillus]QNQ81962.1 HIT family protein [Lactobacillus sp. PV012]QNQ84002.1 HIT family protein [Lactobacillus sp. PV037]